VPSELREERVGVGDLGRFQRQSTVLSFSEASSSNSSSSSSIEPS
jgi:hypothetical protein